MYICKSNVTPFVVQKMVKVGPVPKKHLLVGTGYKKSSAEPKKLGSVTHSIRYTDT
jgi:hypothetical protein